MSKEPGKLQAEIGKAIKELRQKKGYTMQSFADLLGVDRVTVTRYESGKQNLSTQTISAIATALHVEVEILFKPKKKG